MKPEIIPPTPALLNYKTNRICFITSPLHGSVENAVSALLESGIRWIQYREKNKSRREIFHEALVLKELTEKYGACFIVNDYADIAMAVDADGVHLGQEDLPLHEARKIMGKKIIGISTHNISEAVKAEKDGADYIGFGPVFHTGTKDAGEPRGLNALGRVKESVKIPVIAIGGIKAANARSVFDTGCSGVAVSSGLLERDLKENAERFMSAALTN